jgi:hypothetical protein
MRRTEMKEKKGKSKQKPFLTKLWDGIINAFYSSEKENIIPFKLEPEKCAYCLVQLAKWKNTMITEYACEDCVPRGCSCRLYKKNKRNSFSVQNYDYVKDEKGRELPCEEWEKFKHH